MAYHEMGVMDDFDGDSHTKAAVQLVVDIRSRLSVATSLFFGLFAALVWASMFLADCKHGSPVFLFILPFLFYGWTNMIEHSLIRRWVDVVKEDCSDEMTINMQLAHNKTTGDSLGDDVLAEYGVDDQNVLKPGDASAWKVTPWYVYNFFGLLDIIGMGTAGSVPAQVAECQATEPLMNKQYTIAWAAWGVVDQFVTAFHLSGLFYTTLVFAACFQFAVSVFALRKSSTVANKMQTMSGTLDSRLAVISASDALSFDYAFLGSASQAVGMEYLAAYLRNASGDLLLMLRDNDPVQQKAELDQRRWIAFGTVIKKVCMQALPISFWTLSFAALRFNDLTTFAKVKIMGTLLINVGSIISKGYDCLGLGWFANFSGITLFGMGGVFLVKFVMLFFCASHLFNLVGMYCVQLVGNSTANSTSNSTALL